MFLRFNNALLNAVQEFVWKYSSLFYILVDFEVDVMLTDSVRYAMLNLIKSLINKSKRTIEKYSDHLCYSVYRLECYCCSIYS